MHKSIWVIMLGLSVALAGCASKEDSVGRFKVGSPYSIRGKTYYPEENYTSVQTGVASWYGPGFNGKKTANGERFDQKAFTAAHPTLQMPSMVRVTNLENGKSLIVRVNDRGPFHSNRVMDVSTAAADALGFRLNGTARVRLQTMGPESMALAKAAKQGIDTRGAEIAMNETGTLDSRFAAFYPTTVAAPQPDVMIAADGFQPGLALGAQADIATVMAVPASVPIPGHSPVTEIVVNEPLPTPLPAPAIQQQVVSAPAVIPAKPGRAASLFQMSPISEANAAELPPAKPAEVNRLPENPAFRGTLPKRIYVLTKPRAPQE